MKKLILVLLLLGVLAPARLSAAQDARPNIIIIMADDMGYSDISPYGGEIDTPNLAKLAANGVRFTQFYNTARCCPTRASLLTGLYPHQAGIGHMMNDRGLDGYRGNLNNRCRTIAEVLKPAGYATFLSGKWHVTRHVAPEGPKFNWPRQRGFDRFFGTIHGAGSFYDPNSLTRDNTQIPPDKDFYYTDAINDTASQFIREHRAAKPDQPFFMYVAHTAPHWPMHAKPADIAKYRGKYDNGWDAMREQRYQRMVKMGLIKKEWKLSPRDPKSPAWKDAADKDWELRLMEVYAAMVDSLDQGIGRLVKSLKETGQFENTVIMFIADNGGCAEGMGRGGNSKGRNVTYRDEDPETLKPMRADELQFDMIPKRTRDGKPLRQGRGVMAGPADTYLGYGLSWANASNTPFREYKHWVHEGGISAPLIVHWPKGIAKGRHNKFEKQPAHLVDLMATCVDLADATYPKTVDRVAITPLEGVSLQPAFNGQSINRRNPIFWEHEGNRAIRDGKWKAVAKGSSGAWELFNMESDRTELNNLAARNPAQLKILVAQWEAYAKRANVLPWIWKPQYGEKAAPKKAKGRSQKKSFLLKSGANLGGADAPDVANRSFTVTARIKAHAPKGIVVAQGGSAFGWALYYRDGKPTFALREKNKLSEVVLDAKIPAAPYTLKASVNKGGKVTLSLGQQKTTGNVTPLTSHPADGLQVGADEGGKVVELEYPSEFLGVIDSVAVDLR
jgi:arylsulfatase A-like enzyme